MALAQASGHSTKATVAPRPVPKSANGDAAQKAPRADIIKLEAPTEKPAAPPHAIPTTSKSDKDPSSANELGQPETTAAKPLIPVPRPSSRSENAILDKLSDLEIVQRKWQTASCVHFLTLFRNYLPMREISIDTYEDLTPSLFEHAIAQPDVDVAAAIALRDIINSLLVALGALSLKGVTSNWFQSLRIFVQKNAEHFRDCFARGDSLLDSFNNGMDFLVSVEWSVRLGLLHSLTDLAAEHAPAIRDVIRSAEQKTSTATSELELRGYRLNPLGRCSHRRFHYKIGETRIYSGYKRKGAGTLLVECSDSPTMTQLADALTSSAFERDQKLGSEIRDKFIGPMLEHEARLKRRREAKHLAEMQREESRIRNSHRPRRAKAAYLS